MRSLTSPQTPPEHRLSHSWAGIAGVVDPMVHATENLVARFPSRQAVFGCQRQEIGGKLFCQLADLDVRLLGSPSKQFERSVGVDAIDEHEHPLGLVDYASAFGDHRHRGADNFGLGAFRFVMAGVGRCDVYVEPVGTDDHAVFVEEFLTHNDDIARPPCNVDDPVSATDPFVRATNLCKMGGHFAVIVGMLVRHHQHRGGCDRIGFVSMNLGSFGGPFPSFVGEVKAEPSGWERSAGGLSELCRWSGCILWRGLGHV